MRTALLITTILTIFVTGLMANAQARGPIFDYGTTVSPNSSLDAWESFPTGLLRSMGDQVGTINPGESYTVINTQTYHVLIFGDEYYIQLVPEGEGNTPSEPFWVFQGRQGDETYNLSPVDTNPEGGTNEAGDTGE